MGLVNQVVPRNKLLEAAEEMPKKLHPSPHGGEECEASRPQGRIQSFGRVGVGKKACDGASRIIKGNTRDEHHDFWHAMRSVLKGTALCLREKVDRTLRSMIGPINWPMLEQKSGWEKGL